MGNNYKCKWIWVWQKTKYFSAEGNVIQDNKNYYILTEKIIYKKNEEIIFTKNGSEANNLNNN